MYLGMTINMKGAFVPVTSMISVDCKLKETILVGNFQDMWVLSQMNYWNCVTEEHSYFQFEKSIIVVIYYSSYWNNTIQKSS